MGRFIQEDPYHGDGLNLYTYCNNNPVTYYDPSGYARDYPLGFDSLEQFNQAMAEFRAGMDEKPYQ